MTNDFGLSIREIDDLLQHLYLKLKGKKEGLSLAEPAIILLAQLKNANPSFYAPQLAQFTPIIMDTLISEAYISFGYEGLQSLSGIAGDIALATGEYIPSGVEEGLSRIQEKIDSIKAVFSGDTTGAQAASAGSEGPLTGTSGFTRERAWGTAGLPLVSIYNTGKTPFSTGRVVMARLEIRLTGEWSLRTKHDPIISFEHISAEPNGRFEQQVHTAIVAAEKYVTDRMGQKGLLRIPREYRISLPEIASFPTSAIQRLSGGSAGLVIAVLLVSVLSKLDLCNKRLNVTPDTSFTGTVEENGKILTVEDAHIADKVRAVFFSGFSSLVLPKGNLETAEKALAALAEDHPARKLNLVPVEKIADVFSDSGVAKISRVPTGKPLLQRLFLWRKHLFAAGSLTALVLISVLIAFPYFKRDIAKITTDGNRILITNRFGRLITEHEVEFPIPRGKLIKYRVHIEDFDGNGENEALCVFADSRLLNTSSSYNRLHFISFDNKGRFRFEFVYDDEKLLGDQMSKAGYDNPVDITKFSTLFRDKDDNSRFLALLNHASHSPASLVNLSLDDFSNQIFIHQGFLHQMVIKDIDNDKVEDIIISGYNDILNSCVVVVLDQQHMNGSSPRDADYDIHGFKDIAKYYLRLPDFYRYIPFAGNDWLPLIAKLRNSEDGVTVSIRNSGNDVEFFLTDHMKCGGAQVLESFPEKTDSSRSHLAYYDYDRKKDDEAKLRDGIRYWDGEDWVPERAMNRTYLAQSGVSTDSTIVSVDHENSVLFLKNKRGVTIATYDMGFDVPRKRPYRKIYTGDFFEEEEGNEIVCVFCNSRSLGREDQERNRLFILVFDRKGRLLRRHTYHESTILGTEIERAARRVGMMIDMASSPFNGEFGKEYLYIVTHHKFEPPASLIRLSLDDGSYKTFFHKGVLRKMSARDIDGDGRSELLLLGYNVLLDAPVIIALDPDHVGGSSPSGACYNVSGLFQDIAKYYIKLPIYHRFVKFNYINYPLHINYFSSDKDLGVIVSSREEDVIYTISDSLVFTGAEVVREDANAGTISTVTYPEVEMDMKRLYRAVLYWDGEGWVAEPTVNRSYLKHVREGG